jgi:hypothetical protein
MDFAMMGASLLTNVVGNARGKGQDSWVDGHPPIVHAEF